MSNNNFVPRHVAIIMDGNGRWASEKGEERLFGHNYGVKSVKEVVNASFKVGVKYLTLYTFSTENWNRPKMEVDGLMLLFTKSISDEIDELNKNGVRLRFMGKLDELPNDVREAINIAEEITKDNISLTLIVAINYSSKVEICDMVKSISQKVIDGDIAISAISNEVIDENMYLADVPNPDLLIRTSGEVRISNFLLWQISYTELYFTSVLWPDFGEKDFNDAIEEYKNRNRRYGKVTL